MTRLSIAPLSGDARVTLLSLLPLLALLAAASLLGSFLDIALALAGGMPRLGVPSHDDIMII